MKKKYIFFGIIILLVFLILYRSFSQSLFINKPDRVNLLIYGEYPVIYSLGVKDNVNYKIVLYPDLKLEVPGGYGLYRVGAVGKLVGLEKNPELFKKTFSFMTFSFLDYYFYPRGDEIYYGGRDKSNKEPSFFTLKSNADFFDRIYFFWFFNTINRRDFIALSPISKTEGKEEVIDSDGIYKTYLGYFYQVRYRKEKLNVQIVYNQNYKVAQMMSQIVEGTGIRVVDITKNNGGFQKKDCLVIENNKIFSETARGLADFFRCSLKNNKTETSDIILVTGEKEKDWEIK